MGASLDRRPSRTEYLVGALETAGIIFLAGCGQEPPRYKYLSSAPAPGPQHAEATAADASLAQPAPTQQEVRLASVRVVIPPDLTPLAFLPPLLIPTNIPTRAAAIALASSTPAPEPPPRAPTTAATATAPAPREQSTPLLSRLGQSLQALAQAVNPAKSIQAAPEAPPADPEQPEPPPATATPPAPSPRPNQAPAATAQKTEPPATRAVQATGTAQRTATAAPRSETGIRPVLNAELINGNRDFSVKYDSRLYGRDQLFPHILNSQKQAATMYGQAYNVSKIAFSYEGKDYRDVNTFVDQKVDTAKKLPRSRTTVAGNEAVIVTNDQEDVIIKVVSLRDKSGRTWSLSFQAVKNYPPNQYGYGGTNYTWNDYLASFEASYKTFTFLAQTPTPDYLKKFR